MSIKIKLALPMIAGLALALLLVEHFWLPYQLEKERSMFEQNTHELLTLGSGGIIEQLLKNDIGALYSNLDQLERSFEDRWFNLTLYDENNKQLYPIGGNGTTKKPEQSIHVVYPLTLKGTRLGRLELDADWQRKEDQIVEDATSMRNLILTVIVFALLITTVSQYSFIYRPLRKLSDAANEIRQGNFTGELPKVTKDEIGQLTSSFKAMQSELLFQQTALDSHAIVSTFDTDGVITHANTRFTDVSGYSSDELVGQRHSIVGSCEHPEDFYDQLWATIENGNLWRGEICNENKDGEKYWLSATILPDLDEHGVPKRYLSIRTDITEQKRAEEQLRHMANHDALTGLPTRRLCKESLSMALSAARRDQSAVAVMFIDLDGFKSVNDTLGHDAGDELLVRVAGRLVGCLREMDTVARVGGDEFVVVLSRVASRDDVALVARKVIGEITTPFDIKGERTTIGASIGIALYPEHQLDPEELIRCADETMYVVKRGGKNDFAFYDGPTAQHAIATASSRGAV